MNRRSSELLLSCALTIACSTLVNGQTFTKVDELHDMSAKLRAQSHQDRAFAIEFATKRGLPIRSQLADGSTIEIAKIRNGVPLYRTTTNVNAAKSTRANRVHPNGGLGLILTGKGITIGEWDGGIARASHSEFGGRVHPQDNVNPNFHATHVAGTMIAAGVDPNAKGMAYEALVRSYDWNEDTAEMAAEAASGLRISNHSYGLITGWNPADYWYWYGDVNHSQTEDSSFGYYSEDARTWDQVAYSAPYYLPVKSAGNDRNQGPASQPFGHYYLFNGNWSYSQTVRNLDGAPAGYDSVSHASLAKNVLTVGAVDDVATYASAASVVMSTFSSWGPTDDGRIKPDIVGNGVGVYSTDSDSDTDYRSLNGTSMATPNVTGSLALLIQRYRALYAGADVRAATLKGLAIHTADEAGPAAGPDYAFGWGLMNTATAASLITNSLSNGTRISEAELRNGLTSRTHPIVTSAGLVKITLSWTDPAGPIITQSLDNPAKTLMNDLNVRLITSTGVTVLPWVLNPANPSAAATRGDNTRDNVEQILASVPAGTHRIVVSSRSTALVNGVQAYSLLTTGASAVGGTPALASLTVTPSTVLSGQTATAKVELTSPALNGGHTVATSDNTTVITTPTSVKINHGYFDKTFTVTTGRVSSTTTRQISATYNGVTRSANLTILPVGLVRLSVNPSAVVGGSSATGQVALSMAPAAATSVALSDNTTAITTPSSVTVPTTSSVANFQITTSAVTSDVTRQITATLGSVSKTANLRLVPKVQLTGFTVGFPTIEGTGSDVGKLTFDNAPVLGPVTVSISDNSSALTSPSSTLVHEGFKTATFSYTTSKVTANTSVTLTATCQGSTKSTTVTIVPLVTPESLVITPSTVHAGDVVPAKVTLNAPALSYGAQIEFGSTNSSWAYISSPITIPGGFKDRTVNCYTSSGTVTRTVTLSATRVGVTRTQTITLTPT